MNHLYITFNALRFITYTRSSMAVHRRTLARSPTLPTFQVAGVFALPAATASSSLRFTTPLLEAEHFRLLALRCGTACHRRLRRSHLWQPSTLNSRRFCLPSHILTFGSSDIFVSTVHTVYSGPSSVLNTWATIRMLWTNISHLFFFCITDGTLVFFKNLLKHS